VSRNRRQIWIQDARALARTAIDQLRGARERLDPETRGAAERLIEARRVLLDRLKTLLPEHIGAAKTRLHGDYHLGQVLVAKNDFFILDFEGEPLRPLAERRAKHTPMRDVAGMLRSFDYAAWAGLRAAAEKYGEPPAKLYAGAAEWRDIASSTFLASYTESAAGIASLPELGDFDAMLTFFLIEKACYEVIYETRVRPDWVAIPVSGLAALLPGAAS
jgi:maltose alpha-D-glucosyltransferase/alpha-amylase